MVVPVEGHFEQYCNALDASMIGVVSAQWFDLDKAWNLISEQAEPNVQFSDWVNSCPDFMRQIIRELLPVEIDSTMDLSHRMQVIPGGVQQAVPQIISATRDIRQSLG